LSKLVLAFLPLAWIWWRVIDHLRLEWSLNPQYGYGWAVPVLCVYLIWRRLGARGAQFQSGCNADSVSRICNPRSNKHRIDHTIATPADREPPMQRITNLDCSHKGRVPPRYLYVLFALLLVAWLPIRFVQEANPDWRLVSWALALEAIGISLLTVHWAGGGTANKDSSQAILKNKRGNGVAYVTEQPGPWQTRTGFAFMRRFSALSSAQPNPYGITASRLAFPLCFFLVAVPWPTVLEAPLVQTLSRANAFLTVELLNIGGLPALQHGNIVEGKDVALGIEDPCSGIRSLQATMMLSLFLGELYRISLPSGLLLCLLGLPLSLMFNVLRTTILAVVAAGRGSQCLMAWHDWEGVSILLLCFSSLWALAAYLRKRSESLPRSAPSPDVPSKSEQLTIPNKELIFPTFALSAQNPLRLSVSFRRICFLLVWVAVSEIATELWYRSHERNLPAPLGWSVEFPRQNRTFKEAPFSEKAKRLLRYTEGANACWKNEDGIRFQAIYLRWKTGRIAVPLARIHSPELCLTATGRRLVLPQETRSVSVNGLTLPVRFYVFSGIDGLVHVLYCVWEDRATGVPFSGNDSSYANRLRAVLAGCRNRGQQSLELAAWGIPDGAVAEAILSHELAALIK